MARGVTPAIPNHFTPAQRAQLARAIEHARRARATLSDNERRAVREQARAAECQLAERLLEHICEDSTVDIAQHALGVARMILQGGPTRRRG